MFCTFISVNRIKSEISETYKFRPAAAV